MLHEEKFVQQDARRSLQLLRRVQIMFIYKKDSVEKLVAEEVCNKLFSGFLISESAEDKELKKELKDKLAKIKTPEDLKKFMEDNAD